MAKQPIVARKGDGRCVHGMQAKRELLLACGTPGISTAKLARGCGTTANWPGTWVRQHEQRLAEAALAHGGAIQDAEPAFIAVRQEAPHPASNPSLGIQARLPNRVVLDLSVCDVRQDCDLIETLGKLRYFVSTKA